jgi:xanthine dehydrogenase YagR molybdenum-binding subunit
MPHKIKATVVENGVEREVEVEVPDGPPPAWPKPGEGRILGKAIRRLDGPEKVTGRAKYAYDINLPGLLHARVLRSPYASARIASAADVDTSAAERMPGVKAVLNLVDAGGKQLFYQGDEIAAVAAVTPEIAEDAIRAIKVKYQPQPFVVNVDKAREPGAPRVHNNRENVETRDANTRGDVEKGFAESTAIVEGEYTAQTRLHCCLETHGHVCKWDGDNLTVWASTQATHDTRNAFAEGLGLKPAQVRVITEYMGGGFGSKFGPNEEGIICAKLAKQANAPVKLMLTRWDEQMGNFNGPAAGTKIRAGAAADGTLKAVHSQAWGCGGIGDGGHPMLDRPYIYRSENDRSEGAMIHTNTGASAALRAPGHPQASFLMESMMDDLADKLGMDPLEFRRKNDGNKVRNDEYTIGAERIGWSSRPKRAGEGSGTMRTGYGVASSTWGGGGGGGTQVDLTIHRDGSVEVRCGTQDLGTGTRTYVAAIPAEEFGLDLSEVTPRIGDTNYPYSGGSGGSQTTASVAPAVKMAALDAKQKLLAALAGPMGAKVEDLQMGDHKITSKADASKSLTWKQACARLPMAGVSGHGEWNKDLAQGGVAGCQFAKVTVDTETGRVRVDKVVAVHDCGVILNRAATQSQIVGGVIQGIGQALLELRTMDDQTGRMLNPNLEDYKLPHSMEIPEIDCVLYDNPIGKVTGIGEPPVIPTAGAIANAVYNAIGVRITSLPITPDKVLAALGKKA